MTVSAPFKQLALFIGALLLANGGNAQFIDDFSDGDFTAAPTWTGDGADFLVNANMELQLNAGAAGDLHLQSDFAMPTLDDLEWRFTIRQAFSPSSSNFGRVYLVSDQADLTAAQNGYFLQFGEAGSNDAIELYVIDAGVESLIARGTDGVVATSFNIGMRVTRDASGLWSVFADLTGGTNYTLQASGSNTQVSSGVHLGVRCVFTASNADKFYFDDFYAGPVVVDTDPPVVVAVTVLDADNIEVQFDEAVEQLSAETASNYEVQPFLSATNAVRNAADPARVTLTLTFSMTSGMQYNLIVTNVEDLSGNAITSQQFTYDYVVPDIANVRDVVINEIMADPDPQVSLPAAEFIELFNATTTKNFNLANWSITDGSSTGTLPSYNLAPGAYALLVNAADVALFSAFSNVLAVPSFPSLNNTGDPLTLLDENTNVVDAVTYSSTWYGDGVKDDGGWTLEQINPFTPCSGAANWSASNNLSGGTPEAQNSIFDNTPDGVAPSLLSIAVSSASAITVFFDEDLDQTSIVGAQYVTNPVLNVAAAVASGTNAASLSFTTPMVAGQVYQLVVTGVTDCAGNAVGSDNNALFGLPEAPQPGDVVINEVLYDPVTGGSDFVELINNSNRIIDLSQLYIANVDDGIIDNITQISATGLVLLPNAYLVLTESVSDILQRYPQGMASAFLTMNLPTYNNGNGSVVLADQTANVLDRFNYDDDLHFALLVNTEGVSLERVNPVRRSDDATNWHSAAETAGWATPGFKNSQFAASVAATGQVSIEPAIFSPDQDGYQDLLQIAYSFERPGTVATVRVHDLSGRPLRTLFDNELIGSDGVVSWDGLTDDGQKARIGAYLVVFEAFDLSGNTEVFQKTVTLAHQL